MKKILTFIILTFLLTLNASAKEIKTYENRETNIMLDVARRYYTVDEIKSVIDALSQNKNSSIQLHFTDDENVGIECTYLDQTKENAEVNNGVYTNPVTGKNFLTYDQVTELMNYAKDKNVEFIPEIDVPAHMNGFFTLAINRFGYDFVRNPYDWSNQSNSGIAWGSGSEIGNLDLMSPNAIPFLYNILDEYTEFFKELNYFHFGFDEYTFRGELKVQYINEIADYLINKGFTPRMWNDAITKDNISSINNNIEITFWGYKEEDMNSSIYATVKDFQSSNFKILITNKYYLFFVPSLTNTDSYSLNFTLDKIDSDWDLSKWNYNFDSSIDSFDNILGGMICTWGEDSNGVSSSLIINHTINMYNKMFNKVEKIEHIVTVPDDEENNAVSENTSSHSEEVINNPQTNDNIIIYVILSLISLMIIFIKFNNKKVLKNKSYML